MLQVYFFTFFFQFFLKELPERVAADPDHLMTLAFSMKINPRKMKKLEKEYSVKISKEIEEQGEIKVYPIFSLIFIFNIKDNTTVVYIDLEAHFEFTQLQ